MGTPSNDTYETTFTSGQRNIFRQSAQKRTDISLVKELKVKEKYALRYTFDIFNLTNTASFDIPKDNVSQNDSYNGYPSLDQSALPSPPCPATTTNFAFYNCPSGLGAVSRTIGSPRQTQMSLALKF